MKHLLDMTSDELREELESLCQPAYRGRQVLEWVWRHGLCAFEAMTDLPGGLRKDLAGRLQVLRGTLADRSDSPDGVTKLLLCWPDDQQVETVLIPSPGRATACVSTQVGCGMGCAFCASGEGGLVRNLTAGEIVEQVLQLQAACGSRVTHVVLMGMGEPLANYDATVRAIRTLIDPRRGGISGRHVTLSTVGLPAQIRRLAEEGLPLTLAISLHAPNDRLRRRLIPAARGVTLSELVAAAQEYFRRRGREVTLEYTLLAGVNDSPACAEELAALARQMRCNVNLIRYNPVQSLAFDRPEEARVLSFRDRLRRSGVNVQIRASRGGPGQAACGQLRRRTASAHDVAK